MAAVHKYIKKQRNCSHDLRDGGNADKAVSTIRKKVGLPQRKLNCTGDLEQLRMDHMKMDHMPILTYLLNTPVVSGGCVREGAKYNNLLKQLGVNNTYKRNAGLLTCGKCKKQFLLREELRLHFCDSEKSDMMDRRNRHSQVFSQEKAKKKQKLINFVQKNHHFSMSEQKENKLYQTASAILHLSHAKPQYKVRDL